MNIRTLVYGVALGLAALFPALRANAACDTLDMSAPRQLQVGSDIPAGTKTVFLVGVVEQFLWDVNGASLSVDQQKLTLLSTIVAGETAERRAANRLEFRGADGAALGAQRCIVFPTAVAVAAAAPATPPVVVPAAGPAGPPALLGKPFEDCSELVQPWQRKNMASGERIVAFNSAGQVCYQDPRTVAQGDPIVTVVAVRKDESRQSFLMAEYSPCSLRSDKPAVLGDAKDIPAILKTGAPTYENDDVIRRGSRFCYDDNVTITLKKKEDVGGAIVTLGSATVPQYKRYQASVQLGVLHSETRDTSFGLRSSNGQDVIYDKGPTNRGPEYTVSVLLHGFPHYFTEGIGYKGRDVVNENTPADRIGLVLSAGLKDPGNRFGLGLSFEVARGVNLIVVHEWVKVTELAGLKVGDAFTGAADTLPTGKTWDTSTSFGVSFDIAYVTQLFTRN